MNGNRRRGLSIDETTLVPRWYGDVMDHQTAVQALLRRDGCCTDRPKPAASTRRFIFPLTSREQGETQPRLCAGRDCRLRIGGVSGQAPSGASIRWAEQRQLTECPIVHGLHHYFVAMAA